MSTPLTATPKNYFLRTWTVITPDCVPKETMVCKGQKFKLEEATKDSDDLKFVPIGTFGDTHWHKTTIKYISGGGVVTGAATDNNNSFTIVRAPRGKNKKARIACEVVPPLEPPFIGFEEVGEWVAEDDGG